jgi:aryl-phospho-beta-D-glucosidase BglC (GH1 family)
VASAALALLGCKNARLGSPPAPEAGAPAQPGTPDAPAPSSAPPADPASPDAQPLPSPDAAPAPAPAASIPEDRLPLSTCGRWVVDRAGRRVKLAGVNWYGASDVKHVVGGLDKVPLARVPQQIRELGFNSVRLPFSNEMLRAPAVPAEAIAANPALAGKTPLQVFDATVAALTDAGLLVVLNNHSTHAMWCCNFDDDGLWWTAEHSEEDWIRDWEMIADRYGKNPRVVGADLRNEIRIARPAGGILPRIPSWGGGGTNDWLAAATRAGNRVLARAPGWLIVIEGLNSGEDLSQAGVRPVVLNVPRKVVYSAHQYGFFRPGMPAIPGLGGPTYAAMNAADHAAASRKQWGYLFEPGQPGGAPVWLGEFGDSASSDPAWLTNLAAYLDATDADWAYWPLNGGPKASGDSEPFGLLEDDWVTVRNDWRLALLRKLAPATRGPGVGDSAETCP